MRTTNATAMGENKTNVNSGDEADEEASDRGDEGKKERARSKKQTSRESSGGWKKAGFRKGQRQFVSERKVRGSR